MKKTLTGTNTKSDNDSESAGIAPVYSGTGRPLRRSLSIVIPAYNEEMRLPATLQTVQAYLASTGWDFSEIVVVDDGSRDGTSGVARAAGARVLKNPGNRGKGYAVKHGVLDA